MQRYLVETKHKRSDCKNVMRHFAESGHLKQFDWGCESGCCVGWAIIEADSKGEALLSVPGLVRNSTRAIEVKNFPNEKIQSFHLPSNKSKINKC